MDNNIKNNNIENNNQKNVEDRNMYVKPDKGVVARLSKINKDKQYEYKNMILIGASTAGKTSLCQVLRNEDLNYYKTQTVHIENGNMIDTPGEYSERTYLKGTLVVSAADAELVVMVQDPTKETLIFSPCIATMFNKPAIGVVNKIDIATPKQIEKAEKFLQIAGARKIFHISCKTREGIPELIEFLKRNKTD